MFVQFHLAQSRNFLPVMPESFFSVTQFFPVGYCYLKHFGRNRKNHGAKERKPKGKEQLRIRAVLRDRVNRNLNPFFDLPESVVRETRTTTMMLNFLQVLSSQAATMKIVTCRPQFSEIHNFVRIYTFAYIHSPHLSSCCCVIVTNY